MNPEHCDKEYKGLSERAKMLRAEALITRINLNNLFDLGNEKMLIRKLKSMIKWHLKHCLF